MAARKTARKSQQKRPARPRATVTRPQGIDRWHTPEALLAIIEEHKYVNRLLPMLEREAGTLKDTGRADYACLEDVMHYMIHFPDRYHHPKEDLIFDRMSGLAASTAKAVARLRNDHQKMASQARELHDRIVVQKNSRSRIKARQLADDIGQYASGLRSHMMLEETEVLQPARTRLQEADWLAIDQAIVPINDPLFGDRIADRYVDLVQGYINGFDSISSSGSFPVKLVESTASTIEQAVYTAAEIGQRVKQLTKTSRDMRTARSKRLRALSRVRDWSTLQTWLREAQAANTDGWHNLLEQLEETVESVGLSTDKQALEPELGAITLHTEKEIRSFQERPYEPSKNPRISWQAALMNLVLRTTAKQMMRHARLSQRNNSNLLKPSEFVPPGTHVETVNTASFRAVWLVPEAAPGSSRTILHLPGGGFFAPASAGHRKMLAKLAEETRSRAMLVNYRLLPEHPFPAGLEDALAAYRHLLEDGVKPEEIVLSGDSAGGGLALALLFAAREEGLPLPAACALLSPLTDLTFSTAARQANRWKDPLLPSVRKMGAYEQYAGDTPADHPLVSPIYGDFSGFPPMFALVSSTETLLDDTLVVARKARAQGVDCEVEVWENLPHDWPLFNFLPEAEVARKHLADFFLKQLGNSHQSNLHGELRRAS